MSVFCITFSVHTVGVSFLPGTLHVQCESTIIRPGKQVCLTFELRWNVMTNMSVDMAETSVTDFFTLPKLGRVNGVHQCLTVWIRPCFKVVGFWPIDGVEIDAYGTHTHKSHNLDYRWTRRAFMLANSSIMLVKSMNLRVSFSILSSANHLTNLLWLLDARGYVTKWPFAEDIYWI